MGDAPARARARRPAAHLQRERQLRVHHLKETSRQYRNYKASPRTLQGALLASVGDAPTQARRPTARKGEIQRFVCIL